MEKFYMLHQEHGLYNIFILVYIISFVNYEALLLKRTFYTLICYNREHIFGM